MIGELLVNILAALICFFFGVVWYASILPFFQKLSYHGILVKGKWTIEQGDFTCDGTKLSIVRNTTIEISQTAFRIKGKAISIAIIDGRNDVIEYKIKGEIKDRFLTITFLNIDNSRLAHSMFLLEINGNGTVMQGYRVFYSLISSKINALPCQWKRIV